MKGYPSRATGMCLSIIGSTAFSNQAFNSKKERCEPPFLVTPLATPPMQPAPAVYTFFALAMAILPVRTISWIPMGRRISITACNLVLEPVSSTA